MPFHLQIENVRLRGSHLRIQGRIIQGAYGGPERVQVTLVDGRQIEGGIHSQSMLHPKGWPITPEHAETILDLEVSLPLLDTTPKKRGASGMLAALKHLWSDVAPPPHGIDTTKPLIGLGTVDRAKARFDLSDSLDDPLLWANFLFMPLSGGDDEIEPNERYWGIDDSGLIKAQESIVDAHHTRDVWPFIRLNLRAGRFAEFEVANAAEYQERLWIGRSPNERRVLLGYQSGHFTLPALRTEEWKSLALETSAQHHALLLLPFVYLSREDADELHPMVEEMAEAIPGIKQDHLSQFATALLENSIVDEPGWKFIEPLGWITDDKHSQRNPNSAWSILTEDDFAFIRDFFDPTRK